MIMGGPYDFGYGMNTFLVEKAAGNPHYASPKITSFDSPEEVIYAGDSPHYWLTNYSWITMRDEWKDGISGTVLKSRTGPSGTSDHPANIVYDDGFHEEMHWSTCDPFRHLEGANYVFLDGHAQHLKAAKGYKVYTAPLDMPEEEENTRN